MLGTGGHSEGVPTSSVAEFATARAAYVVEHVEIRID